VQRLGSDDKPMLRAETVAHDAKGLVIRHEHIAPPGDMRLHVPPVEAAGTFPLMSLPGRRHPIPGVSKPIHEVPGKQILTGNVTSDSRAS
jgi:hypothetical protein